MQEQLAALEHQVYGSYSLSRHIGELLSTITQEQPADALGSFEEMSTILWQQRHVSPKPPQPSVPADELDKCTAVLALLEKLDSEAAAKVDQVFFDFREKWAEAGVSMGDDQALMLQCSLISLAEAEEIIGVRFWGSFNTPAGTLYVAEADIPLEHRTGDAPVVGPYDVPPEVGVGVNRYVYYVTRSPFDPWVRLPDARPSDIANSRRVIWQLSGDLSAAVHSYVPFDVTEDVYIRALIARISSATILAPNGYMQEYVPEEEEEQHEPEGDGEEEEEAKEPPPKQLKLVVDPEFEPQEIDSIEWVHIRPFILPQGRETYKKAPKPPKEPKPKKEKKKKEGEEEEEEEEHHEEEAPEEEEDEPEEGVELFGSVENDEGFGEEEPCWNFRTVTSPVAGESFVVSESLRWPGAYNLTDGKKSCSLYYGTGTKFVVNGFQPPVPPKIAGEYRKKMRERIDPTVDEEKEVEKLKHPPKEEEDEEEDQ